MAIPSTPSKNPRVHYRNERIVAHSRLLTAIVTLAARGRDDSRDRRYVSDERLLNATGRLGFESQRPSHNFQLLTNSRSCSDLWRPTGVPNWTPRQISTLRIASVRTKVLSNRAVRKPGALLAASSSYSAFFLRRMIITASKATAAITQTKRTVEMSISDLPSRRFYSR
jgi:hypothetical protein